MSVHEPLDLHNWRPRRWHPARKKAYIERARPYDLRHTYATLQLYDGMRPQDLHHLMGHGSWATTLKCYSHQLQTPQDGLSRVERSTQARQDAAAEVRARGAAYKGPPSKAPRRLVAPSTTPRLTGVSPQ